MRLDYLKIRGLGPYREDVDVDFAGLDAQVVAVAGANGAGKSTLLELLAGAIYRQCPTRGPLSGLATTRDAYVEARVVNGKAWTIRQTVDAHTGKGEALVLDSDGHPVLEDGKVRTFDAWAREHLPRPEVLYASTFAVQGGEGSFLDLKAAERKAVLLRTLGIEHLEQLAEKAREKARDAAGRLEVLRARIDDERARFGDVDAAGDLAAAEQVAAAADADVSTLEATLAKAREEAEALREARRVWQEALARAAEVDRQRAALRPRIEDLERRAANNRQVIERAEEIRGAVRSVDELAAKMEQRRSELVEIRELERDARHRVETHRQRQAESERARTAAQGRAERAQARLEDRERIEEAADELPGLRDDVARAETELEKAEAALEKARSQRIAGAEDRIVELRGGLTRIVEFNQRDPQAIAKETLEADDRVVEGAERVPALIEDRQDDVAYWREKVRGHQAALTAAEQYAARAPDLAAATADIDAAAIEDVEATAQIEVSRLAAADAEEAANTQAAAAHLVEEHMRYLETERASCAETAALAPRLDQAEARLAELEPQIAAATEELAGLEHVVVPEEPAPAPDVEQLEADVARARTVAQERHAAVAVARQRAEEAQATAERLAKLESERVTIETEVADWTRLSQDLGRDGLQALEIDAAGPELTATVNDLLHGCVGTRWTVRIDTTRSSADGKRQLEGLDVVVVDTERGREAPVETFSGGERVIIGEAVSLALATLATKRAGITGATLVRDESGAALDPENGRAYIAMLRRAAELTGARQVLFVSHAPELQELADARIEIADGKVEVRA